MKLTTKLAALAAAALLAGGLAAPADTAPGGRGGGGRTGGGRIGGGPRMGGPRVGGPRVGGPRAGAPRAGQPRAGQPNSGPRLSPKLPVDGGVRRDPGRSPRPGRGSRTREFYYYDPFFYRGGFGFGGLGFGLGYGAFSPFYDPFYYSTWGYYQQPQERDGFAEENVEVRVEPKKTEVYVNGLLYSKKGRARFDLPAGDWTIELRAEGYEPQIIDLRVEPGLKYQIRRKLQKVPKDAPVAPVRHDAT